MTVKQGGVECYILPDCVYCAADEQKRNPLDIDDCPIGCEECDCDFPYYEEDWE